MTLTKALIAIPITLLALVFFLAYTGLIDHLMWRMPAPPDNHMGENIAQQLGFDKNTKLLIVNSDDTGANPTFTHGIERVMKHGLVRSNSIIVHDRNDHELARIATLSKSNPEWGFGVHLMLTNEYQAVIRGHLCCLRMWYPPYIMPKVWLGRKLVMWSLALIPSRPR